MSFIRTDMATPKFVGGSMIDRAQQPVAPQMGAVRLLGTEESVIVVSNLHASASERPKFR
jgi:hypothetical protein